MSEPLISIITVTYNAKDTIVPTINSVKNQTCNDYEFLLIDGASTDGTVDIVKDADVPNARIYSSPDEGLYHAMNKGLGHATGKYVIFLNAGDSFHSNDTLEVLAKAAIENEYPGIIYGQTDIVDSKRNRIGDRHLLAPEKLTLDSFRHGMVVCHQAFMTLKRIAPLFNTKYRFSADYDWCIQCLQHSRNNVYTGQTLIDYLSEGVTTSNRRKSLIERFKIMCYYYGTLPTMVRHIGFAGRFIKQNNKQKR